MNRLDRAKRAAWRWLHCLVRPGYVAHLEDLLKHVDIHGAYRRGGYDQMTTDQKKTFNRIARQPFTWELGRTPQRRNS